MISSRKILPPFIFTVFILAYLYMFTPVRAVIDFEVENGTVLYEGIVSPVEFSVPMTQKDIEIRQVEAAAGVPVYLEYRHSVWPDVALELRAGLNQVIADSVFLEGVIREIGTVYERGVVDFDSIRAVYTGEDAVLRKDSLERVDRLGQLGIRTLEETRNTLSDLLENSGVIIDNLPDDSALLAVIVPNITVDMERRNQFVQAVQEQISMVDTVISAGDTLVPPGGTVTTRTLQYLSALRESEETWLSQKKYIYLIGRLMLILLLLLLVMQYTRDQMPEVCTNSNQILLLATVWIISLAGTGLIWRILGNIFNTSYASLVTFGAALTSIFFNRRHAVFFTLIFAFTIGIGQPHPYSCTLVIFISGILTSFAVWDIRKRSSVTRGISLAASGGVAAFIIMHFLDKSAGTTPLQVGILEIIISQVIGIGSATALLAGFESVFHMSTGLAIREAIDRQHSLLLELSRKAMGTWQHSQAVADLAAEAAVAIGADAQLAEAGGLFHDIGKLAAPEYYIENLMYSGGRKHNPHNDLEPIESAIIITAHVRNGVKLAREHKVPEPIINIIAQSHGTSKVKYFLEKARSMKGSDPELVDPDDYAYDGPLPKTREAAIVLIADSVESAVKALRNPDPAVITEIVKQIIAEKDREGQFDECHLTRPDMRTIEGALIQVLVGRFHERVQNYPYENNADG